VNEGDVRRTSIPRSPSTARSTPPRRTGEERGEITAIVVAVPARDEAASVAACLEAIDLAAAAMPQMIPVHVVVAADCCRDGTAAVARAVGTSLPEVTVLEGRWHGPGASRAAAVRHALGSSDPATTWLANTDADCLVPPGWLALHLVHAEQGIDAVAGTVVLDDSAPPDLAARFEAAYLLGRDAHGHVHAANLGVRADAYLAVGGWLSRTVVGEEHDLWRRLSRAGFRLIHPLDAAIATSPRRRSRVRGGFATWLEGLDGAIG
jgi:glycosyltransferase involved in cell wall biosynthesis